MKMKLLPVAVALLALLVVASCRDLAAVPAAAQAADGAAVAATDDNAQAQIKPTGYVGGACIIVCRYCKLPGGDCFSCDCGH